MNFRETQLEIFSYCSVVTVLLSGNLKHLAWFLMNYLLTLCYETHDSIV